MRWYTSTATCCSRLAPRAKTGNSKPSTANTVWNHCAEDLGRYVTESAPMSPSESWSLRSLELGHPLEYVDIDLPVHRKDGSPPDPE